MGASPSHYDYDADLLHSKKARASWPKPKKEKKEKKKEKAEEGEGEKGEKDKEEGEAEKEESTKDEEKKEEKEDETKGDAPKESPAYRARKGYSKKKDGTYKPNKLVGSYTVDDDEYKELQGKGDIEFPQKLETLNDLLNFGAAKYGDKKLYGTRKFEEDGTRGDYVWMSYAEFRDKCRAFARGLNDVCNIKKGDNVGIFGVNRIEWCITSWANMTRGYRSVALYDTLGPVAIQHILGHAELTVVSCEKKQIDKLLEVKKEVGDKIPLKYIIQFDPFVEEVGNEADEVDDDTKKACEEVGIKLIGFSEILEAGAKHEADMPDDPPTGDDLAFIMYTSGTTGVPKGAMLAHENLVATAAAADSVFDIRADDRHLSYLTLAHIYETVVHVGYIFHGASIAFFNGDIRKLIDDFPVANPTILCGVPRVYQRIYDRVMANVAESPRIKQFFFRWFLKSSSEAIRKGQRVARADNKLWIPLRERLGLKDVRICVTGAAPMPAYLSEFLKVALGSVVLQGYGLTETAAAACVSQDDDLTVGHCGPPLPCCEIKLVAVPEMDYSPTDEHPRGEVWIRGPNVFRGYYKDEDNTKAVFPNDDGFFATGDIGRFNPNGTLSIIDRKKNIFKMSQGEYIATERIEGLYAKAESVGQIWVYGNSYKPFVIAVVVPQFSWVIKQAKAKGWWPKDDEELQPGKEEFPEKFAALFEDDAKAAFLKDAITQEMRSKEGPLKGFEKVRDILLETDLDDLGQGFNVDNNCLTPSFKLRRPQLKARYKDGLIKTYKDNGEEGEDGF